MAQSSTPCVERTSRSNVNMGILILLVNGDVVNLTKILLFQLYNYYNFIKSSLFLIRSSLRFLPRPAINLYLTKYFSLYRVSLIIFMAAVNP